MRASRPPSRWSTVLMVVLQAWCAAWVIYRVFGDVMPLTRVLGLLLALFFVYRIVRNTRELVRSSRATAG